MKAIKYLIIILTAIITTTQGNAQILSVSVQQACDYAIEHNRLSINASLAIKEAEAQKWEAIANGLPQVDVGVDYTNYLNASNQLFGNTIEFTPTSNATITVSQLLFSGNYYVGIQMAKIAKSMSETNKTKTELDLRIEVANAYYLALVSQKSKEFATQNLENLKEIHQKTKLSVEVGVVEQTNLDQLTVQVGMVENNLRSTERQIEVAYNLLRLQMGLDVNTEIELTDNLTNIIAQTNITESDNRVFDVNNNIDYQLMEQQESLVYQQVRLQKAAALPTLAAYYNYIEKLKKPAFDMSPKQMIGLNLSIPIFSSGMRCSRVKQATIQLETIQNQREMLSEQLQIKEKQARFNLKNAWEQYLNQNQNIEVSERVFNSIKLKFEQGLVSGIDLTTANSNYVTAQNNYILAALQLLQAGNEMERLYISTK